jgi:hypothetical protein
MFTDVSSVEFLHIDRCVSGLDDLVKCCRVAEATAVDPNREADIKVYVYSPSPSLGKGLRVSNVYLIEVKF